MSLTESELKTVRHSKTDLRLWTFVRYVLLLYSIASVLFSFRLIYADPYFLSGLGYWVRGTFLVTGILLASYVLRSWNAPKSSLLVKLVDEDGHDAS